MGPALYVWSFVTSAQQGGAAMALTKPITLSPAGGHRAGERARLFKEESCPGAQGHICSTPRHRVWFLGAKASRTHSWHGPEHHLNTGSTAQPQLLQCSPDVCSWDSRGSFDVNIWIANAALRLARTSCSANERSGCSQTFISGSRSLPVPVSPGAGGRREGAWVLRS